MAKKRLYVIAPLVWESRNDHDFKTEHHWADSPFGTLHVDEVIREEGDENGPKEYKFSYCVDEFYDEGSEQVESIDDGKKRAEQFLIDRIMPALVEAN